MRFCKTVSASACAGLAIIASAPTYAKAVDLQPISPWNIDYAPNKCRLARVFGEGADKHLLFFEQYAPSTTAGLTVAGAAFDKFQSRKRTYLTTFSDQEPIQTEPFKGEVDGLGPAVVYSSIDLAEGEPTMADGRDETAVPKLEKLDDAWAAQVQYVSLRQKSRSVTFRTGPLDEAFAALNQCTKTLISDWGLDAEKHVTAQSLPQWQNENRIVRQIQKSYPAKALNLGEQAILQMRVVVDENGGVTDCFISKATTSKGLESAACGPMYKAKFKPALDAEGSPFKSFYATSVTYRIGR